LKIENEAGQAGPKRQKKKTGPTPPITRVLGKCISGKTL